MRWPVERIMTKVDGQGAGRETGGAGCGLWLRARRGETNCGPHLRGAGRKMAGKVEITGERAAEEVAAGVSCGRVMGRA